MVPTWPKVDLLGAKMAPKSTFGRHNGPRIFGRQSGPKVDFWHQNVPKVDFLARQNGPKVDCLGQNGPKVDL